mmetsp:Transcript_56191/g.93379  ORF Transcript_56191/g.93379 Transcript_56191/m.93379 type:complete len:341 (+) Transcript_56191:5483-6505(+)
MHFVLCFGLEALCSRFALLDLLLPDPIGLLKLIQFRVHLFQIVSQSAFSLPKILGIVCPLDQLLQRAMFLSTRCSQALPVLLLLRRLRILFVLLPLLQLLCFALPPLHAGLLFELAHLQLRFSVLPRLLLFLKLLLLQLFMVPLALQLALAFLQFRQKTQLLLDQLDLASDAAGAFDAQGIVRQSSRCRGHWHAAEHVCAWHGALSICTTVDTAPARAEGLKGQRGLRTGDMRSILNVADHLKKHVVNALGGGAIRAHINGAHTGIIPVCSSCCVRPVSGNWWQFCRHSTEWRSSRIFAAACIIFPVHDSVEVGDHVKGRGEDGHSGCAHSGEHTAVSRG